MWLRSLRLVPGVEAWADASSSRMDAWGTPWEMGGVVEGRLAWWGWRGCVVGWLVGWWMVWECGGAVWYYDRTGLDWIILVGDDGRIGTGTVTGTGTVSAVD